MSFKGYCTTAELAAFLDFGNWRDYPIQSYKSTESYVLPTISADNQKSYIIDGTVKVFINGVASEDYLLNLDTGAISFSTAVDGDSILIAYYINRGLSNTDLEEYALLGARMLESDTNAFYREVEATYATDGNEGLDYINYVNSNTLQLLYNIAEVKSLAINGNTVTPSTVKVFGTHMSLTRDSEVKAFSGKANTTLVTVIHGIPDPELGKDYTEEQKRLRDFAKSANLCISAMYIYDSAVGKNTALDNSYVVQRSDGSVRPDITVDYDIRRFAKRYEGLINILKQTGSKLL